MPAPTNASNLLEYVKKSGLLEPARVDEYAQGLPDREAMPPAEICKRMVADGLITEFHAKHLMKGRYRNFFIGKFKVLQPLGSGGMSQVYLCEHAVMKHRVAMKLLPARGGEDKAAVTRFLREARAAAAVNHPNVVRAHDFDLAEGKFYYLIMEFVDGVNLHDLIKRVGPLPPEYAANYIAQSAAGLQHILECGLIHRDLKPSNLLVDHNGTVRILDLGLARFTNDDKDNLTRQMQGKSILGTADFLAPEQAIQADNIDIRADIYSLGATLYFLLSGRAPFEQQSVTQKLLAHQMRDPEPLVGVPDELAEVVQTMMQKNPADRYQSPNDVVDALSAWTSIPLPPPDESWFVAGATAGSPSTAGYSTNNTPSRIAPASRAGGPPSSAPKPKSPASRVIPGAPTSSVFGGVKSTAPRTGKISTMRKPEVVKKPSRKGLWIGLGVGGVLAAGIAVAAAMGAFSSKTPDSNKTQNNGTNPVAIDNKNPEDTKQIAQGEVPPTPAGAIVVGAGGQFKTVAEALKTASNGARIVVTGPIHEELLRYNGTAKSVTVEAWPAGKVSWRAPANATSGQPLVLIQNSEGFRLKGFVFDGRNKIDHLVALTGNCPALVLDDISVNGFLQSGIHITGLIGDADRPARLFRVKAISGRDSASGIRIDTAKEPVAPTKFLVVDTCRFESDADGRMGAGIRIAAPVEDCEFRANRFFQTSRGIHFHRDGQIYSFSSIIANNTFASAIIGIAFDGLPTDGAKLTIHNNLFLNTQRTTALAGITGQPTFPVPEWICHKGDIKGANTTIPAGMRSYRKTFDLATIPTADLTLDIGAVTSFKVWVNGQPAGESSPAYFTKRVFSFPIKDKLKPGKNVIAIEVSHSLDPLDRSFGSASGLMVRVGTPGSDAVPLLTTDATWVSVSQPSPNWQNADGSLPDWNPVHVWPGSGGPKWPWLDSLWDSVIKLELAGAKPITMIASDNIRDYQTAEGYPMIDSIRGWVGPKVMGFDPTDDASFLRNPRGHLLNKFGTGGTPVGVPPLD